MPGNIVLLVRFQVKPGKKQRFLWQITTLVETMSAESNFVNSVLHQNVEKPDEIVIYETWRGTRETWLREEFPRPYRGSYEQILSELVESRTVDWLTPIDDEPPLRSGVATETGAPNHCPPTKTANRPICGRAIRKRSV